MVRPTVRLGYGLCPMASGLCLLIGATDSWTVKMLFSFEMESGLGVSLLMTQRGMLGERIA